MPAKRYEWIVDGITNLAGEYQKHCKFIIKLIYGMDLYKITM